MTEQRDELIESLGMGISRRTMLKRMGYGLAGAAIAPSLLTAVQGQRKPGATLSATTPQPVWDYTSSSTIGGAPALYQGTIVVPGTVQNPNGSFSGLLYGLDVQTKEVRWQYSYPAPLFSPLVVNNTVYAAEIDEGGFETGDLLKLNAIDLLTGNILWQSKYNVISPLTLAGGLLIFTDAGGSICAVYTQADQEGHKPGDQAWTYPTGDGVTFAQPAVMANNTVVVMISNTIYAVDLTTGTYQWQYSTPSSYDGIPLSAGNGVVYFTSSASVEAIDVTSGTQKWTWTSDEVVEFLGAPTFYNGVVHVGDIGGNFYAVNADTGVLSWQINNLQGDDIFDAAWFEDGIAYFTTGLTLYAIDLASNGQDVVSFTPSVTANICGLETGVCYYYTGTLGTISAVNMAGLLHQFFCESELMVEDYVAATDSSGNQTAQGNSTSFRTHVQLFDPNHNPRANKSVKVSASDVITIISGGQTYDLDPNATTEAGRSAWLKTDAAGELSIVSMADSPSAPATSISSPALYLWGNFMELGEAIVIYPDHDTINTLANVQGSDLTSTTQTTYDGQPLLSGSSSASADSLAQTIRYVTGGGATAAMGRTREKQRQALAKKRPKRRSRTLSATAETGYLAFPESTPNMIYQPVAGPSDRTYVPGEVTTWNACFDASGGVTLNCGTAAALRASSDAETLAFSFDDFVHDIVKGADKIASIVWDATKDAVATITSDIEKVYNITISALEDAVNVVAGILKTVVGDLTKAIQWLSYLFDWDDILATKDALKATVTGGYTNLTTWITSQQAEGFKPIQDFFNKIEGDVSSAFASVSTQFGGQTLQLQQQNDNNPQAAYGAGGAKSYTKSRWMTSKVQDNASGATVGGMTSLADDACGDIICTIQTLVTYIGNVIAESFSTLAQDIADVFKDLSTLVTKPSEFVSSSFSDILTKIGDIINTLLQLVNKVVDEMLTTLLTIIDDVIGMLNQTINIPVISDLYKLISGGDALTILDVGCLAVAIPTTIVAKALNAITGAAAAAVSLTQNIGYAFALAVYAILDPLMDIFPDVVNETLPLKYVYLGLSAIIQGLNFPTDFGSNTAVEYLFYVATAVPLVMTGIDVAASTNIAYVEFKELWESSIAPVTSSFYGLVMLGLSLSLGVTNPQFQGKDYLLMIQNVFSFIPFIFKPLGVDQGDATPQTLALGLIDGVSDLTVLGLAVAQWEVN